MHNPVNTFISFGLLIAVVAGSFYFVYANTPPKPWTGITNGLFLNPDRAEALGLDREQGLLIYSIIPESPADRAGLRGSNDTITINGTQVPIGGDIIVSMDGSQLNEIEDVCAVLAEKQVGDSVVFEVSKDNSLQQINVMLAELPSNVTPIC